MIQPQTYGLFRGRFQPFHNGHIEKCNYILNRHQILVLGLVVVKPNLSMENLHEWLEPSVKLSILDSFQKKNNPYSYIDTSNIIIGSLKEIGVDLNRIRIIPHFTPLVYPSDLEFLFTPPQNDTILYIAPKGEHNIFGIDYYASRGWKVEVPPRIDINFSGTVIRQKLKDKEDLSGFLTSFAINYLKEH